MCPLEADLFSNSSDVESHLPELSADCARELSIALLDVGAALGIRTLVANKERKVIQVRGISAGVVRDINNNTPNPRGLSSALIRVLDESFKGVRAEQTFVQQGPPTLSLSIVGIPHFLKDGSVKGIVVIIFDTSQDSYVESVAYDFISAFAHELKSPLGAISILADSLGTDRLTTTQLHLLELLRGEVKRATSMVNSLLAVSHAGSKNLISHETVKARDLIDACLERVATLAEARAVTIEVDAEEDAQVYGNVKDLTSALCHLVENAIQLSGRDSKVEVVAHAEGWQTTISVRDCGIGISKDDQERIFDRFVRLDKAKKLNTEGSGLGLSIVKRVVFANGGEVNVQSELGKGSTFTLQLAGHEPLHDDSQDSVQQGGK